MSSISEPANDELIVFHFLGINLGLCSRLESEGSEILCNNFVPNEICIKLFKLPHNFEKQIDLLVIDWECGLNEPCIKFIKYSNYEDCAWEKPLLILKLKIDDNSEKLEFTHFEV